MGASRKNGSQESSFSTGKDSDMAKLYNAGTEDVDGYAGQDLIEYALLADSLPSPLELSPHNSDAECKYDFLEAR